MRTLRPFNFCRAAILAVLFEAGAGGAVTALSGDILLPRPPDGIAWNGNLAGLKHGEFIAVGADSLGEASQAGYIYQAWNDDHLLITARVADAAFTLPKYDAFYCDGLVLYLDSRAEAFLHHTPYRLGGIKLIVYPSHDSSAKALLQKLDERGTLAATVPIDASFTKTPIGWDAQVRIPWKLVGFTPRDGAKIGIAVRLLDASDPLIPGQERTETTSAGSRPETDAMALNIYTLSTASAPDTKGYAVNFEEVVENGQIQLHGTVFAPPPATETPKLLTAEIAGQAIPLRWRFSAGRNFRLAEFTIPIAPEIAASGTIKAAIREANTPTDAAPIWFNAVPLPVARMRHWTTEQFAKIKSAPMPPQTAALVGYLEQLAEDAALRHLNGKSNLQKAAEADPANYTDPALPIIVQAAQSVLDPEVAAVVAARVHVWKSKLDGTWQAFVVALPLDYTPDKKWPLEIRFHPLYNSLEAVNNAHQVTGTAAGVAQLFYGDLYYADRPIPYQGDRIRLTLWGRGNAYQELGEEEFLHALDYGVKTLGGDPNSVILNGHSAGATDAMLYAQRYADVVAATDLLSGGYVSRLLAPESPLAPSELRMLGPIYDLFYQAGMLRGLSGRLMVGADDPDYLKATRTMAQALFARQPRGIMNTSRIGIIIAPNTGHNYEMTSLPPTTYGRPPATLQDPVVFGPTDLRYARKDGLAVRSVASLAKPWAIRAFVTPEKVLTIESKNLARFSLTGSAKGPFAGAQKIEVNGKAMGEVAADFHEITFTLADGIWRRDDGQVADTPGTKTPQSSGPILDIRRRPFLIVRGTKDADAAPLIRARAAAIVRQLSGWHNTQDEGGRFFIVDDTDCTPAMWEGKSVWLIGNREENALYEQLAGQAPISVAKGMMKFGSKALEGSEAKLAAFIIPGPANDGNYVLVEAATAKEGYAGPIYQSRAFDYAVNTVDLRENPLVVRGFFDENWRLSEDLAFWRK
jgi:pimeloyl-ACP methyl ester carboxylesterase